MLIDEEKNTISDIGLGSICLACGLAHVGMLTHPDECLLPPMYSYPYSNKCGVCNERAVKAQVCQNCGCDYRRKKCEKCGTYYATCWDQDGGCPKCQNII